MSFATLPAPKRIETERKCYIEEIDVVNGDFSHAVARSAAGDSSGTFCNAMNIVQTNLVGGGSLTFSAGAMVAGNTNSRWNVKVSFKEPVTNLRIAHQGLAGPERVFIPTTYVLNDDFVVAGPGTQFNPGNGQLQNNNQGPSVVTYLKEVSEVDFIIWSSAGLSSVHQVQGFTSKSEIVVSCTEDVGGGNPCIMAICDKTNYQDITADPSIIDTWTPCEEAPDPINMVQAATGIYSISYDDQSAAPININATDVVTGHDLTQGPNLKLNVLVQDLTSDRGWQEGTIDVDALIATAANGTTVDYYMQVFDNDYILVNLIDAATGTLNLQDPGRAMEYVKSELIMRGVPDALKVMVDQSFDATYAIAGADIHDAGAVVDMTAKVEDAGWSSAANVITFTGTPEKVTGYVTVSAPDGGVSAYWARPKLRVIRAGAVIAIVDDLVMQQNTAYDGDAVINGVFFDKQPGANPEYTFEWFDQETRTTTLPPRPESQISLTATQKVEVVLA